MRVSIILSVHADRVTVSQTIESILRQSYKDWHLVICHFKVNSTVEEIIKKYAKVEPRISLHEVFEPGYVPPLNVGLEVTKLHNSEFVCMIDSDDIMLPDRLNDQVNFLDKHLKHVLVGGQRILIDLENRIMVNKFGSYPNSNLAIKRQMVTYPPIIHPSVLIRKSAIHSIKGYRTMFPHGTDSDLWMRLDSYGKFHNLSKAVIAYRIDNTRISDESTDQLWKEILHVSNCFKLRRIDEDLDLLSASPSKWLESSYKRMNSFNDVNRADRHFFSVAKKHCYLPKYRGTSIAPLYRALNGLTWIKNRLKWRIFLPLNLIKFWFYKIKWQAHLNKFL